MGRNRGMYVNYGTSGRRPGRKKRAGIGTVCAVVLVLLLAVLLGVLAYQVSKQNIEEFPEVPTPTPTLALTTPTPLPTPTETPTPTPTPTETPTPLPTSPETGIPCTPTPPPTVWDANYLDGFEDTREKVDVKGAQAGLTLNSTEKINYFLNLAETTELNAIVIDIKADSGKVTYQMDCQAAKDAGVCISNYKDMNALLTKLKEKGIYCIARIVCFKDNMIDETHPEWMIHKNDGSMYKDNAGDTWMNPYNRDTWVYIVDIAEQAVLDGFDEICFDYIRFSTNGIIASGNSWDTFEFKVDFGEEAETTSLEEIITQFTIYACNRLKPLGAFVSASVYGAVINSKVDSARVGQSYVEMSRYLDYICPMVYPSHYSKNYAGLENAHKSPYQLLMIEMKASVKKLKELDGVHCAEVRPWLQGFSYTAEEVRAQMQALYENGYQNWMLWNSAGNYVEGAFLSKDASEAEETE